MDSATVAALAGALASTVAWLGWTMFSDYRTRVRIRTMLRIELNDNLSALQMRIIPLPEWKFAAWDAITSSIPLALNEREIKSVHDLRRRLLRLCAMKQTPAEPRSQWSAEFEDRVREILTEGNPLR